VSAQPCASATDEEVSSRLQWLEEKHHLLRHTIGGWAAWPVLRLSVARAIQAPPLDRGASGFSKREMLPLAMRDVRRVLSVRRADYLVKTLSSYHSELVGGRKKDIFFDDLSGVLGDFYKIETINGRAFHRDTVPNLRSRDISTVALGIVAGKLVRRYPVQGVEEMSMQFSTCLREELGIEFAPRSIVDSLASFHWTKRLYRTLLKRVRPKVVLVADVGEFSVTAAARELGMKVVEFQHGMVQRHYPASSWSRYALPHKKCMAIPDRVFLYGAYWRREMEANGFWTDELRSVGSLRVDDYRVKQSARNDELCTLLVTTQGIDSTRLIAFFEEFIRLAEGRAVFRLIFKMHPVYQTSNELFATAFGKNASVELISAAQKPTTFELLKRSHLHLSIYSTCHYEALALGVPTVILPLAGAERMRHLHEANEASFPQTPGALVDLVRDWRKLRVANDAGDEYFAPHALENIQGELADLSAA
jgi:hypothetical protein